MAVSLVSRYRQLGWSKPIEQMAIAPYCLAQSCHLACPNRKVVTTSTARGTSTRAKRRSRELRPVVHQSPNLLCLFPYRLSLHEAKEVAGYQLGAFGQDLAKSVKRRQITWRRSYGR